MLMARSRGSRKGFARLADLPGACPITWAVIGANVVTFLLSYAGAARASEGLVFDPAVLLSRPWTVFSYPLVAVDFVVLLVSAYMFWLFSGSLERSWGGWDYVVFLGVVTAAPAIALWVGMSLTGMSVPLAGLWLPVAATAVAWATINPYERVLLYFVIPLEARWLGLLAVLLVFFSFRPFPLGVFALAGCGVAWWYARGGKYQLWRLRRGGESGPRPVRERSFTLNPLDAIQRWRRKRQFMRLIKRSGFRDHDS